MSRSSRFLLAISTAIFTAATLRAESPATAPAAEAIPELEPIVVTATRTPTPLSLVASDVTVITAKEIQQRQVRQVSDALRGIPGVDVVRSGGMGQTTSVFLRGANSNQTLVLIDGIPANNPGGANGAFDFAHLSTDNVERIEVVRGPMSTLYGSNAIGGVVNIITKEGKGKPTFYLSGEAGSFGTFRETMGTSGGDDKIRYSVGFSRTDTDGISAGDFGHGSEKDAYDNTTVSGKLSFDPCPILGFDLTARSTNAHAEQDTFNNVTNKFGDDPNARLYTDELFVRPQARLKLFEGLWQQKAGFSFNQQNFFDVNEPDRLDPTASHDAFFGEMLGANYQSDLYVLENNVLTLGYDFRHDQSQSDYYSTFYNDLSPKTAAETHSYYLQDQIKFFERLTLSAGVRLDDHSVFGDAVTYRTALAYLLKETGTTFKGSVGTGFRAPSLYELNAPYYGNRNLKPEESLGWDAGLEQEILKKRWTAGATYFENYISDLIDYSYAEMHSENINKAQSKGIELQSTYRPWQELSFSANYTYTHTVNEETGQELLRRAPHQVGGNMNYEFLKKGNLNLGLGYRSTRDDVDSNTFSRFHNPGYSVVNAGVSWQLTDHVQIFTRMENALDSRYQEVAGYTSPGFAAFGGIKLTF